MSEHQEDILASVLTGLLATLRALALAIVIALAGAAAALAALAAIVLTAAGAALSALAAILRTVRDWLREFIVWIVRLACLAAPIIVGVWAWPRLVNAFGADGPAYIPATLIVAFPPLLATLLRRDHGAMVAAAVITALITLIVLAVPPIVRQVGLVILLAALLLRFIHTARNPNPTTLPATPLIPPSGETNNGTQEIVR